MTILHEASRDPYIIEKYPNQIEWLNKIKFDDIGYLFKDTLVEIGVRDASFFGRDVTLLA
ncbi:MAG: hypothetical protein CMF48_01845 [Legionellales bacterium]|nr:hypothetical protein [Legionellales bacterium]